MAPYYRNRETGIVQWHPVSGLGDAFNSDEIGTDGAAVKPFVALPVTPEKVRAADKLLGGKVDKTELPAPTEIPSTKAPTSKPVSKPTEGKN